MSHLSHFVLSFSDSSVQDPEKTLLNIPAHVIVDQWSNITQKVPATVNRNKNTLEFDFNTISFPIKICSLTMTDLEADVPVLQTFPLSDSVALSAMNALLITKSEELILYPYSSSPKLIVEISSTFPGANLNLNLWFKACTVDDTLKNELHSFNNSLKNSHSAGTTPFSNSLNDFFLSISQAVLSKETESDHFNQLYTSTLKQCESLQEKVAQSKEVVDFFNSVLIEKNRILGTLQKEIDTELLRRKKDLDCLITLLNAKRNIFIKQSNKELSLLTKISKKPFRCLVLKFLVRSVYKTDYANAISRLHQLRYDFYHVVIDKGVSLGEKEKRFLYQSLTQLQKLDHIIMSNSYLISNIIGYISYLLLRRQTSTAFDEIIALYHEVLNSFFFITYDKPTHSARIDIQSLERNMSLIDKHAASFAQGKRWKIAVKIIKICHFFNIRKKFEDPLNAYRNS